MTDLTTAPTSPQIVTPLDERARAIYEAYENCAITIGGHLIAAKEEHPGRFTAWVDENLPFGIDQAERLMAITRCFANADDATRASLPSAKSALFELTRLPADRLKLAIEQGDVHPEITTREARRLARGDDEPYPLEPIPPSPASDPRIGADIVARELMRFPREQLSADMERKLRTWLS